MNLKTALTALSAAAAGAGITFYVSHVRYSGDVANDVKTYLEHAYKAERAITEKVPIYEDFATGELETAMRRHLLPDHLEEAKRSGRKQIASEEELKKLVESGGLVSVEQSSDTPYYFYNVPAPARYLSPEAKACLLLVAGRFQENIKKRAPDAPLVKLAVSSAVRSVSYQQNLREKNANASFASSHSYGISYDIFYDDYFVALAQPGSSRSLSSKVLGDLRPRLGYLMGDALARQFRSVLLETLFQLQNEGKLYAILEKNQRCYHVTVRH